jgi:hypothetical protein
MTNERWIRIVTIVNLLLVAAANVLTLSIWYSIFTDDVGTMFVGLLMIPLAIATIYYLMLFRWGIRLTRKDNRGKDTIIESFALFLMNIVPIALIYLLTS